MARRHIKSDFAPDVYVFPGGKADAGDVIGEDCLALPALPRHTSVPEPRIGWEAVYAAAIRELFEEAGLLLAHGADGELLDLESSAERRQRYAKYCGQVRRGELTLAALARREGLKLAGDTLLLFANWITPEIFTKRFDTFFFLARLPKAQHAHHADLRELTHILWIDPSIALARYRSGGLPMVVATERNLERLTGFDSVDALWLAYESLPTETVRPRWQTREGERIFLIPGDPGYEDAASRQ